MKQTSLASFIISRNPSRPSRASEQDNAQRRKKHSENPEEMNPKKRKRKLIAFSRESDDDDDDDDGDDGGAVSGGDDAVESVKKRPRRSVTLRAKKSRYVINESDDESDGDSDQDDEFRIMMDHTSSSDDDDDDEILALDDDDDGDDDERNSNFIVGKTSTTDDQENRRKDKTRKKSKKKKESDSPISLSQYVEKMRYDPENTARVVPQDKERRARFIRVLKEVREHIMRSENRNAPMESEENGRGSSSGDGVVAPGTNLTPLEQQVTELKKRNPGIVLMVEVGYKMRFFGEDAHIASKVLGVIAYKTHNLFNASIPTYRLNFHLRRLLAVGYKVGIVKQTETSAVKASGETDNKSGPFTRAIHSIFSRGTSILGDDVGDDGTVQHDCGFIISIVEESMCSAAVLKKLRKHRTEAGADDDETESGGAGNVQHERIGIVCVNVSTGTIMYDYFEDTFMRRELASRLTEMEPVEVILPSCRLSKNSEFTINNVVTTNTGDPIRVERMDDTYYDYAAARSTLKQFYEDAAAGSSVNNDSKSSTSSTPQKERKKLKKEKSKNGKNQSSNDNESSSTSSAAVEPAKKQYFGQLLESILELPKPVLVALNTTLEYLRQFRLEDLLRINSGVSLQDMNARNRMNLSGITLQNLEILRNNTNQSVDGSLLSIMNHTKTPFGLRLLKQWICRPLINVEDIRQRLDAVEEIKIGEAACLDEIADSIRQMPDVEKTLMKAWYKKCSPKELLNILSALKTFYENLPGKELWEAEIESSLLLSLLQTMPDLTSVIDEFLDSFNHTAAEMSMRDKLFEDVDGIEEKFPDIALHSNTIKNLHKELDAHLTGIRQRIGRNNLELKDWKHERNVLELTAAQAKKIEKDKQFVNIHSTKTIFRFHTTFIIETNQKLQFHREKLHIASASAWNDLMDRFASHFNEFKRLVDTIATLDCLYSLAETARQGGEGYCKPEFTTDKHIMKLKDSRHPLIELTLKDRPFVANSITMNRDSGTTAIILSGANMGGKSSLCRQIALIAVMAQIGSFVPCSTAILPVFDGIFIRAGAQDDLINAKSTFFVELSETSEILQRATPNSLIIMDELGRGTSTSDGKAIAYCTLEWLVKHIGCFCLFTTHYPMLFGLERRYPNKIRNYHMGYIVHEDNSEENGNVPRVTFLYKLKKGFADRSYGLNVARLAGLEGSILREAEHKAKQMEQEQVFETKVGALLKLVHVLRRIGDKSEQLHELEQLKQDVLEI